MVKFRVDRIYRPELAEYPYFADRCFPCTVELKCENTLMNAVVDRFGEDVQTRKADCAHFITAVEVSVSPTFFAWVFTYDGKVEILSPPAVKQAYRERLIAALNEENIQ